MSNQITVKMLESAIKAYAREMGYSTGPNYVKDEEGHNRAVIDSLYLDQAYGGCNVARIVSESGGIDYPLGQGYMTKRDLWQRLWDRTHAIREYRQLMHEYQQRQQEQEG